MKKLPLTFILTVVLIFVPPSSEACGASGSGTIYSYLFGTILQVYSVYCSAAPYVYVSSFTAAGDGTVDDGDFYDDTDINLGTYFQSGNSCSITSGNGLTVIQNNFYITGIDLVNTELMTCEVEILATWTVAYNATLKAGANVTISNGGGPKGTPSTSTGYNFSVDYNYSYSNSNSTTLICMQSINNPYGVQL